MKKLLSTTLALVMAASVLTACNGGGESTAPATSDTTTGTSTTTSDSTAPATTTGSTVIKIGGVGPLTGPAAIYGNAAKNGAQIAVDEINALGGIQFELRYEDDTHDPEKAVNAYNALKDWNMQVSLGAVTSTPGVAISPLSVEDRIFTLTPSASAVKVTEGADNVFQMCFADPNQGSASAQYISENALGQNIAIIYKNDDVYSTGIHDTFVEKAAELGLNIVSDSTFTETSQTDFSVQLLAAKDAGADLVFLPMYYTPASLILQQAQTMGYAPKFFGVDGMDGILTMENFDTALAEGVMLLTPFNADATDEATVNFVEQYKNKFGDVPNQFAADAYDCVYAIYQAVNADGTITSDSSAEQINDVLVAQFTTMTFNGLTGENVTWTASGQVSKSPKGMIIENGAYVGMD